MLTALSGDVSKLLLAARKIRRATSTEFVISLVQDDFSRASNSYVGKLRFGLL
jgi:tubby-related protein 1